MNSRLICLSVCVLFTVVAANADVTQTGPFSGESFEGFEAIGTPGSYPGPVPIFNGDVTMNDTFANIVVIAFNLISFRTDPPTEILPYNGNLMGLSVVGRTLFDFTVPVTEFGGYIGTADDLVGTTVTIRDADGQVLLAEPLTVNRAEWDWHGWSSTTPMGSIEFVAHTNPGFPLAYDDMQVNFVPEPSALALLAGGAALLLRRRR